MNNENPLALTAALAVGFLGADTVAKKLPGTLGAQIGWGSLAALGTYFVARQVAPELARALSLGVAGAYLHAYGHRGPYRGA